MKNTLEGTSTLIQPQKSEINREFEKINENVEYLISSIQLLEIKLKPVLSGAQPIDVSKEKNELSPSTDIGMSIREFSNKIYIQTKNLNELMDRLEI